MSESYFLDRDNRNTHDWEPLSTSVRRTREDDRLAFAEAALKEAKDHLIVQDRVRVVHAERVGAIVEHNIRMWNPFAEIGLCSRSTARVMLTCCAHLETIA